VDLQADVAVGAPNPMRGAGAAQDSGRGVPVCPEAEPKSMGASGAAAPDGERTEHRVAVETARREPGTE
jgi:hypothetical protein